MTIIRKFMEKIGKDCHRRHTFFFHHARPFAWSLAQIDCDRVYRIVTRALNMFGPEYLRINYFHIFFSVSLYVALWQLIEPFHYRQLSLLSLLFSAVRPNHLPQADIQIRPWKQSIRPSHQTIRSQPGSDHHILIQQQTIITTRPPNQTIRSADHHPQTRPKTTDHHLPIRTAYPASWNGTGQVHSLWVGSRGVYRALDELCKAYFPHTFGLTFRTFFRLKLIVVRLASGVPWAGKGLPFPFP